MPEPRMITQSNPPQTPPNPIPPMDLATQFPWQTQGPSHSLNPKLEQLGYDKALNSALPGNCSPNPFTDVKRAASRDAKRLNSQYPWKLGNIRKVSKIDRMIAQSPRENESFKIILTKNSWKTEIKLFPQCVISHEN